MADGHLRYWFVLRPGNYQLIVSSGDENGRDTEEGGAEFSPSLKTAIWEAKISLSGRSLEPSLSLVQNWLKQMHVGEELELIGLYKAGDSSSRVPAAVRQYYSHTLTAIGLERESYILGKNLSDEEISNFNADDGPGWALSHGQDAAAQHQLP